MKPRWILVTACVAASAIAYAASRTMYIRSKSKLRSGKNTSATVITVLSRGTPVKVLRKSRAWREVKDTRSGAEGWVHKSRLTKKKPAGSSGRDGLAVADASVTGIEASAAIRGLTPEAKQYAQSRSVGPEAQKAVNVLIAYKVSPTAMDKFMQEGKLGEYSEGE